MRVANLIPLIRLPRSTGEFSYSIPDNLDVKVGQIVKTTFRGRALLGLVSAVNNEAPPGITLKPLTEIVTEQPIVAAAHIHLWSIAAKRYGVHPSVVARMGLPPLKKTKLAKAKLTELPIGKITQPTPINGHWHSDATQWKKFITELATQKTVVIFPEQYQLDQLRALLDPNLLAQTIVWDSQLSEKDQFTNWIKIRNGEFQLVLGTRSAIFLPLLGTVKHLVLDFESDTNHKHWDQQPRFHTRDVAEWLRKLADITIHYSSPSPSVEAAGRLQIPTLPALNATVVHYTAETGHTGLLARPLVEKIKDTALAKNGDIVCILNRRGFATTIVCRDCGFVAECTNCHLPYMYEGAKKQLTCRMCGQHGPHITSCPKCKSPLLALRGGGTERVAEELRTILLGSGYTIHAIDKESATLPEPTGPRCLIGTDALMSQLNFSRIAIAAVLDTDAALARPEFTATAHAWHRLADLRFWLPTNSSLYIQTRKPDHGFYQSLANPTQFYRTELANRQALGYPPYTYLTRFLCGADSEKAALNKAQILKNKLTTGAKNRIVQGPIPLVPMLARGQYWAAVLVRFETPSWIELEQTIEQTTPDTIIDPNPISLFSLS